MTEERQEGSEEAVRRKQFVLVVDGAPRDLLTASMLIQNFGYSVTSVRSAEEALEFISIAVPSLVVMEYILPGMNGRELLERIRNDPDLASIPIIVQTSFPNIQPKDLCEGPGCTLYLRKPIDPELLYRAVQSTIESTPRQNLRIDTYLRASVDGAGQGAEIITVLSDSGMFVKTLNPRPVDSRHTVSFLLGHRIVKVTARVIYTYGFGEGPYKEPGMGMTFTDISPKDRELVRQFLREHVDPQLEDRQH